jgi:hypothetical protein
MIPHDTKVAVNYLISGDFHPLVLFKRTIFDGIKNIKEY